MTIGGWVWAGDFRIRRPSSREGDVGGGGHLPGHCAPLCSDAEVQPAPERAVPRSAREGGASVQGEETRCSVDTFCLERAWGVSPLGFAARCSWGMCPVPFLSLIHLVSSQAPRCRGCLFCFVFK